jgi:hypothetical protein
MKTEVSVRPSVLVSGSIFPAVCDFSESNHLSEDHTYHRDT